MQDTALWVALILALFTIAFGTRHLDAAEHHEGMVAAIAFESLVKLLAFLAVGVFVTFGIYDGFGDVFARAAARPEARSRCSRRSRAWRQLLELGLAHDPLDARDHVPAAPVPGHGDREQGRAPPEQGDLALPAVHARHQRLRAADRLRRPAAFPAGIVDADTFVLTLPMAEKQEALALLVFIGGLSAATGMVIVETIALSTMVCNDLVMPVLLRMRSLRLNERRDLTGLLLGIRRGAIVLILLLGYLLLPARRRGLRAGLDRPDLVRRGGAVRAGGARRHFLEGRHARGALAGLIAGFVGVVVHAAPAGARALGLAADRVPRAGPWGIEL